MTDNTKVCRWFFVGLHSWLHADRFSPQCRGLERAVTLDPTDFTYCPFCGRTLVVEEEAPETPPPQSMTFPKELDPPPSVMRQLRGEKPRRKRR